jgi:hypothetical protein
MYCPETKTASATWRKAAEPQHAQVRNIFRTISAGAYEPNMVMHKDADEITETGESTVN